MLRNSALLGGGLLIENGNHVEGHGVAGVACGQLVGVGVYRWQLTGKHMPGIPMIMIGAIGALYNFKKAFEWLQ